MGYILYSFLLLDLPVVGLGTKLLLGLQGPVSYLALQTTTEPVILIDNNENVFHRYKRGSEERWHMATP